MKKIDAKPMRVLSIETSCDETAIALVEAKGDINNLQFKVLADALASQIDIHREFGGVVPNLAKREHIKNLPLLFGQIFGISNFQFPISNEKQEKIVKEEMEKIDFIVVTVGPGLEPALWAGIQFAQELAKKYKKNLLGVNHLEGHLYSFLINQKNAKPKKVKLEKVFPAVGLVISGGHTVLVKMDSLVKYKKIGETVDDAVGEAYDKVARLLGLPYPGGPEIEMLAKLGKANIPFPRPMLNQKNYNFSFSGLKTAVLYYLRDNKGANKENIATSFQEAAFDVLIKKTIRAVEEISAKSVFISGGVAANKTLQAEFEKRLKKYFGRSMNFFPTAIATDNALMIASAGYINYLRKKKYKIEANGNLNL